MTAVKKLVGKNIDEKSLKKLIPLNTLGMDRLREIAAKSAIQPLYEARTLFRFGDTDGKTYYLLEGEVEVQLPSGQNISIKSDTPAALHPLSDVRPRQATIIAKTNSTVLSVDRSLLEILVSDSHDTYEVNEIQSEDESDWMTRFLKLLSVMSVPVKNIEQLMQSMQEYPVRAGDVVIRQADEAADHYFIVKEGRCAVTKQASSEKTPIRVAELAEGSGFGEEALLSKRPRGATVTMLTDGLLMRLSREDFNRYIAEPALSYISADEARAMISAGAKWIDVRSDAEYRGGTLPGALSVPLSSIRAKSRAMNTYGKFITCADSPPRAAAAGFVLRQLGFSVAVLNQDLRQVGIPLATPAPSASRSMGSQELKTYGKRAVTGKEQERPAPESPTPGALARESATAKQLAGAQADVESLRSEVEMAQSREQQALKRYAASQDSAKRDLESFKEQSDKLQKRLQQTEHDRVMKARELERLKTELEQARMQAEQEVRDVSRRTAQLASQHVADAQEEARSAQERANEFSLNLVATEAAHEATRKEVKQLHAELNRLRGEMKREQDEIAAAKEAQASEIARMKRNFDQEMEKKRAAEEALRSAEEEAARLRAEAEAARKRAEDLSRRASETESKRAVMLSEAKRKAEAAEAMRRDAEEQARLVAEMDAAQRRALEESERRAALADEIRRKADNEITRLKAEADAARRAEEEKKRAMAEEQARKIKEAQTKSMMDSKRSSAGKAEPEDLDELEGELARLQKKLEAKKRAAITRKEEFESPSTSSSGDPELQQNVYEISQKTQKLPAYKPTQSSPTNLGKVQKSGWVSDAILWETTLGLRNDTEAESVLHQEEAPPAPAAKPEPPAPAAEKRSRRPESSGSHRATSSGEFKTKPTFTARDFVPTASPRVRAEAPESRSNFGLIVGVAIAVLAIGGIALVATSGDEAKKVVAPAVVKDKINNILHRSDANDEPAPSVTPTQESLDAALPEKASALTEKSRAPQVKKPAPVEAAREQTQKAPAKPAPKASAEPSQPAEKTATSPNTSKNTAEVSDSPRAEQPAPKVAEPEHATKTTPAASAEPAAAAPVAEPEPAKPAARDFSDKAEPN